MVLLPTKNISTKKCTFYIWLDLLPQRMAIVTNINAFVNSILFSLSSSGECNWLWSLFSNNVNGVYSSEIVSNCWCKRQIWKKQWRGRCFHCYFGEYHQWEDVFIDILVNTTNAKMFPLNLNGEDKKDFNGRWFHWNVMFSFERIEPNSNE